MLRGPQTLNELKIHSHRMFDFDDLDDVQFALQHLVERDPPMVTALPRQSGQKEGRFAHLLSGEPDIPVPVKSSVSSVSASGLEARVADLEARLEDLKNRLEAIEGARDTGDEDFA